MAGQKIGCKMCHTELTAEQNAGSQRFPLCKSCMAAYFYTCVDCGEPDFHKDMYYEDGDTGRDYPHCQRCAPSYGLRVRELGG